MGSGYPGGQPEYCIFYGVSESGTVGFYRYDLTDKTIQRYFEQSADGNTQTLELQDVTDRYNSLVDDYNIARIALGCGGSCCSDSSDSSDPQPQRPWPQGGRSVRCLRAVRRKAGEKKRRQKKESRKNGRKLSREERYMMGEEDDYEDDYEPEQEPDEEEPEDDELEIQDAQEYIPDPAQEADAQLDQVKKAAGCEPGRRSRTGRKTRKKKHRRQKQSRKTMTSEVFDLDDEL